MEALVEGQKEEAAAADEITAKAKELFDDFNDLLSKAQDLLMSKEVILHDQIEVCVYDTNLHKAS